MRVRVTPTTTVSSWPHEQELQERMAGVGFRPWRSIRLIRRIDLRFSRGGVQMATSSLKGAARIGLILTAITIMLGPKLLRGQTSFGTILGTVSDSSNATVGTVINNKDVVNLPLNGRSYTELLLLVPGSVPTGTVFAISSGHNFSVSGADQSENNYSLDGIENNELFFKQFAIQPSIDAIQEFKVQTNITSAEYGQAAGSNVNVAIKSGTNQLHGSLFEFLRNDKFDASDFFANYYSTPSNPAVKPAFRQNQFGGVIGGPVVIPHVYNGHDKLFWLFNYEGLRIRRASTGVATVPTTTELSGDLQDQGDIFDPATTRTDPVTGL